MIASETGPDFSAFPFVQNFSSRLGVAPGTRISGGKPLPGRAHGGYDGTQRPHVHGRQARLVQKHTPVAITATARELACLIYLMATRAEESVEQGMEAYEKRLLDDVFVTAEDAVRQVGLAQVLPDAFGRVQLRRSGRQEQRRDVVGELQFAGGVPDTDSAIEDRPVGGLGVHLVRIMVDEASYRREGGRNHLTLVKRRDG